MKTVEYQGQLFPEFQCKGRLFRFQYPILDEICNGNGYDITYHRESYSKAIRVLPEEKLEKKDFIVSDALCFISSWKHTLLQWIEFAPLIVLYIPSNTSILCFDAPLPFLLSPQEIETMLVGQGYTVFCSQKDMCHGILLIATH
jgi:hypothetical protein